MPHGEVQWLTAHAVGKLVTAGWADALWSFLTAVTPQEIAWEQEWQRRRDEEWQRERAREWPRRG